MGDGGAVGGSVRILVLLSLMHVGVELVRRRKTMVVMFASVAFLSRICFLVGFCCSHIDSHIHHSHSRLNSEHSTRLMCPAPLPTARRRAPDSVSRPARARRRGAAVPVT